ncbi:helix-turn-helix transcriptional regulator [Pseudomonas sp. 3A(2025)]
MGLMFESKELDCMAEIIWRLCEYKGKPDARSAVLQLVAQLLHADYAASFVWDEQQQRSTRRCSVNIDNAHLNAYDAFFHQVDLVTPAMRPLAEATNVDRVIQRSTLQHSQFYCDFLKPAGMHHGINVYFFDQGRDVGDLRIWRGAGDPAFGEREERILKELTPYFTKSLAQVACPGARLSQREADVARLVANGASDKEVARQLGIAFTTVRTHLNNAMNKLECTNRTQLSRHF